MLKILKKTKKDEKMKTLDTLEAGSWIFAWDLSPDEIEFLAKTGFDEDLLEDALDYFEVPHFEYEEGILYFFTRYVLNKRIEGVSTAPLLLAISDKYFLSVSHRKPEFLDNFAHNRELVNTTQRIKFFLILLEKIIHTYDNSLIKIRRELLKFLANVESVSDSDLKEIVKIEGRLNDYISALHSTSVALTEVVERKKLLVLHEEDIDILEDLIVDVNQIIDNAKSIYKMAQNIRNTHEVILGHKLNTTMKVLAALTILLGIPTVVTGTFGMNVWLPVGESPVSFFAIVILTAILSFVVAKILQKKGLM